MIYTIITNDRLLLHYLTPYVQYQYLSTHIRFINNINDKKEIKIKIQSDLRKAFIQKISTLQTKKELIKSLNEINIKDVDIIIDQLFQHQIIE